MALWSVRAGKTRSSGSLRTLTFQRCRQLQQPFANRIFIKAVDGRTPTLLRPALSFGKVPMFYFLLHFVLIHLIAVVVCFLRYGDAHWMFESPSMSQFPVTFPTGWGFPLPVVYLLWIGVVVRSIRYVAGSLL